MRLILTSFLSSSILAAALTATAQQPSERSPDRPPRDEGAPRREGRPDDDGPPPPGKGKGKAGFPGERPDDDGPPPPPGKGGPRGKSDFGDKGRGGGGFGGGFSSRSGGPGPQPFGGSFGSADGPRPAISGPEFAADRELAKHDRNGNGKLEREEWPTSWPERDHIDANGDGIITVEELNTYVTSLNAARVDRERRGISGMRFGGGFGGPGMGPPGPAFGEFPPDDPEMRDIMRQDAEMDRKTHELAMRVREARGEERTKLKTEITEHVNKHFEVRQKRRELQLKRMEEELQRLRDAISSRNKSRESIVTNHIKELIGEEHDLEF